MLVCLFLSCSPDVSQLDATIDTQNARLAQLEDASEENTDDVPTNQPKAPLVAPPTELSPRDITTVEEPDSGTSTNVAASEADPTVVRQLPTEQAKTVPTLLWSAETESDAYIDNVVFLQTSENTIEAREMSSGSILWSVENGGEILGTAEDNVYVALTDQRIEAYDSHRGAFK